MYWNLKFYYKIKIQTYFKYSRPSEIQIIFKVSEISTHFAIISMLNRLNCVLYKSLEHIM